MARDKRLLSFSLRPCPGVVVVVTLIAIGLWLAACGVRAAAPPRLGDLDQDGQLTILDLQRLINHFNGTAPLPDALIPFADLNQDGVVNEVDVSLLANAILGVAPLPEIPLCRVRQTSPVNGEGEVAVTRDTVFRLTVPLSASTLITTNELYAVFGGRRFLSRVELSSDRKTVSLFYLEPLPGGVRVRVTFDGSNFTDFLGRAVDLDGDGQPGGIATVDFDTLSNQGVTGTKVAGRVFASELAPSKGDTNQMVNQPLVGVTITVDGQEETLRAVTDQFGNFLLDPAPAGKFFVHIDGRTATNAVPGGGYPHGSYYPFVGKEWESTLGQEVNIGNVYLPLVVAGTLQTVSATQATMITFPTVVTQSHPELNGVTITVPPNSLFNDNGTRGGMVGIAPVPPDRLPSALPPGLSFPLVITVQSDGALNFDQPVPACFPNLPDPTTGQMLPPGAKSALWSFNHRTGQWEIQGSMTVSADGKFVCTDPGVGIPMPGWHGVQPGVAVRGGGLVAGPLVTGPQEPPTCQPANATDPIYLFSGEFQETATDLVIKGRGMDFSWTRKYRSKIGPNSIQGNGWDCMDHLFLEAQGTNLVLHDGNSRADVYAPQPDGTYAAPGLFRQLVKNADGTYTLTFADKGQWTFYALDGTPASGKRSAIVDRNGNRLSYSYDAQGRVNRVRDTLDRDILFAYDAQGFLATITDFAGRTVRYDYYDGIAPGGNAGDLKSVTSPAVTGTPNGNDFPNGKTTTYTYSTGYADERLNHNLLTITDGRRNDTNDTTFGQGPYLINIYSGATDPTDPNFDHVVRQIWGGGSLDIVYVPILPSNANGNAVMKTIVRDRNGNVKEYFYDANNLMLRSREFTGRADATQPTTELSNRPGPKLRAGDPDYFETIYEWTADLLQRRVTHPNRNVTEYVYEADLNPQAPPRTRGNVRTVRRLPGDHVPAGDQDKIEESYVYDTDFGGCCGFNFVTQRTDGRGNTTSLSYDTFGNLVRVQDRVSTVVAEYQYNTFGQLTARIWPDNGSGHRRRDMYTYYPTNAARGYLYQETVDADGLALVTTFEYDAVGNVSRVVDPRGHDSRFVVNALNQVVRAYSREVTDGSGVRYQRDYAFDANNNLVRLDVQNLDDQGLAQSPSVLTTQLEYEMLNQLVRVSQPVSANHLMVTEYGYDANRNCTLVRYGEAVAGRQTANTVQTVYDERDLVFQVIRGKGDPAQSTTQSDYDGNRNRVVIRQGLEGAPRVRLYTFDGYDRPVGLSDPMGNVTSYTYDADGDIVRSTLSGELNDVPGSAGNVPLKDVTYVYDAMRRLVRTEAALFDAATQKPLGAGKVVGRLTYADISQVIKVVDGNGNQKSIAYDTAHRRASVTDQLGNVVAYAYDANGNLIHVTETERSDLAGFPASYVSTFAYDNLDRLIQRTDPLGYVTDLRHDARDNLTQRSDARRSVSQGPGNLTTYSYDGLSRLISTRYQLTSDGTGAGQVMGVITNAQTWDDTSRLASRTDGNGNTAQYFYDALNRRIRSFFPDQTREDTTYDVNDNPIRQTDPNGTVLRTTYDLLDRPIRKDIQPGNGVASDTLSEIRAYDGLSRLVQAQDDHSLVARTYDPLARLTAEIINGKTNAMTYDAQGNLLTWSYPGGRQVTYTYDGLNRRKTVADQGGPLAGFDYVGPRRVARRTYANNTFTTYDYDGDRRLARLTHNRGSYLAPQSFDQRSFGWDAMNNKTSHTETGGLVQNYSYDSVQRLINSVVSPPQVVTGYILDAVGNRLSVTGGPDAGAYVLAGGTATDLAMNRYTATPFDTRSYDANGNLIAVTVGGVTQQTLTYDYRNRLVAWTNLPAGLSVTFQYDVVGRRLAKTVHGLATQTTHYFYRSWQLAEEQDDTGATLATYVYGTRLDELLTYRRGGQDYYLYADDLDSVRRVADAAGSVVEAYSYGDYGAPAIFDSQGKVRAQSAIGNPNLFTGRRWDPETGLYEMRTRYLDPRAGRFHSPDIAGAWFDAASLGNAYTYAANSAQTQTDPYGLSATCPTGTCPSVPADVAAVSGQSLALGPAPQPVSKGKVLVLIDRSEKQFLDSQKYFQKHLEELGYSIVSYNANNGRFYNDDGTSHNATDADYQGVVGLLVIGHGMSGQLANMSADQILDQLRRTGPVKFIGLWGCHSMEVYDEKEGQFNAALQPGGAVFGFDTFLANGMFTHGFAGGSGGTGSWLNPFRSRSDPFFDYLKGDLPPDIYVISDRWGEIFGTVLGGGD